MAVITKGLDGSVAAVAEHEQSAIKRIGLQPCLAQPRQAINAGAKINRLHRHLATVSLSGRAQRFCIADANAAIQDKTREKRSTDVGVENLEDLLGLQILKELGLTREQKIEILRR